MINFRRPNSDEYAAYYETYVGKIAELDFLSVLKNQKEEIINYLSQLSDEQWNHKYEEGKWSPKEMMIHLNDAERVFAYRAMRVSRNDQTPLPGFDQNDYVPYYNVDNRTPQSILNEYASIREATLSLYENFSDEDLNRKGTASGFPISVLALGFIIAGHEKHHVKILKERYFKE